MARHPQPRRITLGGHEAVALTVREYEQLIAGRRQIGGQSARVRVLAQQVKRTEQLLNELENLISDPADCHEPDCHEPDGREPDGREPDGREPDGPPAPECRAAPAAGGTPDAECLRCATADLLRRHRAPAHDRAPRPRHLTPVSDGGRIPSGAWGHPGGATRATRRDRKAPRPDEPESEDLPAPPSPGNAAAAVNQP
ncbi:hypothetical protein ABT075_12110 [Streptomyces sp. NPDC002677]|uniref:hypothetical protein n=1 Tax=Streptomyces sp. NPDC002677 TaxID=3154774 RepID=UPI0033171BEE